MSTPVVLVTGATGFIGGAALARLFEEADPPRIAVLVRAPSQLAAEERLRASLARFVGAQPASRAVSSLAILTDVASALVSLLFRPTLRHRVYHISAGESESVGWREIIGAFARAGAPVAASALVCLDPNQVAATELSALFTDSDCTVDEPRNLVEERLRVGLSACARFGALPAQCFDNRRLLSEGFAPPLRFTEYLERCVFTSRAKSIYRQLRDDEC